MEFKKQEKIKGNECTIKLSAFKTEERVSGVNGQLWLPCIWMREFLPVSSLLRF